MMDFVTLTLSFTLGLMLAIGLSTMIMMNPKVMMWYMNYMLKSMNDFDELLDDQKGKGL